MPNIGAVLRDEIARLTRRSTRPTIMPLKKDVSELKRIVREQREAIFRLSRDNARLIADLTSRIARLPEVSQQQALKVRISPRLIKAQRNRLNLSQEEFGKLLGVSGHTVFLWEHKKVAPRPKIRGAFAAVRQFGRREARERLQAMARVSGDGHRNGVEGKKVPGKKPQRKAHAKKA